MDPERELEELDEADDLAALEDAATCARLRAQGYPRTLRCLACDRPRLAASPGDRLCNSCRRRAAEIVG